MTGLQAICVLMIRLWAAGIIVSFLLGFTSWFLSALIGDNEQELAGPILEGAIWIAAALAAWVLAPRLPGFFVPPGASANLQFSLGVGDIVAAGSFLIGGFYLVDLVPQLVAALGEVFVTLAGRDDDFAPAIDRFQWTRVLSTALTVAVALFLTLKPREIARMFASLRHAGLAKVDEGN
jgi:hypothetical protein